MTRRVSDSDQLGWLAHAHIDKFAAADEREAAFTLFPKRARMLERVGLIERGEHGGLQRHQKLAELGRRMQAFVLPHITGQMMLACGADVIGTVDHERNGLANAGINRMGSLLIAGGGQGYNLTNTAIGVGDSTTAFAASQTDLQATVNAANRWVQIADSVAFAVQVLTVVATFATGNANLASGWQEWGIGQNTVSAAAALTAPMLNRKVANLGTKTSAAAWQFTVTITIS